MLKIKLHIKTILFLFISFNLSSQCFTSISTMGFHNQAIKNDGSLWTWGNNEYRQIGDNTNINRLSPTQITQETNWQIISTGTYTSTAIKNDGTVWYWGRSYLGTGCCPSIPVPQQLVGFENSISVAQGLNNTAIIKSDGTLWVRGWNEYGALGNGTFVSSDVPVQVGSDTNWQSVSIGSQHITAIKSDGTMWGWGWNSSGQVGDGTTTNRNLPVQIGNDNNWVKVYSGYSANLALKANGTLWAWGWNTYGQLGDGTTTTRRTPVQVGNNNDWVDISITTHSLAIKSDGSLWAWGYNNYGKLGLGLSSNQVAIPTQVGTATNWVQAIPGFEHTIALQEDGSLWAWGRNHNGQLGDGTLIDKPLPTQIAIPCPPLSLGQINQNEPKIYPNPTNNLLNIEFENSSLLKNISVFNVEGKLLLEFKNIESTIDISSLPAGLYLIKMIYEKEVFTSKIIKN
jgi:alpha-tubulin suppressor-like RCC1 family protein